MLVPLALLAVLFLVVAWIIGHQLDNFAIFLVGVFLAFVALLKLLQRLIVLSSHRYMLTDRRVVRMTGIVSISTTDSYLDKINNVEHRQSFWGRILGYGDVEIDTASETGMTRFLSISQPLVFKNAILQAMEKYKSSRYGNFAAASAPRAASGADKIRELKALLDEKLISEEEYEAKRKRALEEM